MTQLVVGCPVRDRLWVLPVWFDYLARATAKAGVEPFVLTVGDPQDESVQFVEQAADERGWGSENLPIAEIGLLPPFQRAWNIDRYRYMADLRNLLLAEVKRRGPDIYWSLDSDILVHEDALVSALDALEHRPFDAVGQRCYMTAHGTWCASYCMFTNGGLLRDDSDGCFPVDCIMASKVMTPRAYDVGYIVNEQGEDIGWSIECARFGVKLGWDGRTTSKHVMAIEYLHLIDPRCGF